MKNIALLKISLCLIAALLLCAIVVQAEPARNAILGDLKIVGEQGHSVVQVGFTFPVRYIRNYPLVTRDELRIQLEPIAINPDDVTDLYKRESIAPEPDNPAQLIDVVYEGSDDEGRYLTLYFSAPTDFEVEQGDDYRSLKILIWPLETPAEEEVEHAR